MNPTAEADSQSKQPFSTYSAEPIMGAHIFLRSLIEEGVDTVFGMPGGVILSIYDVLPHYTDRLRHILVRHEQGATHMAEGYAKSTGRPGVVLVTSGPGATNVVTGIADAYYDSVPLVVFTGNVPTTLLGNDAFQEADIVGMTRACTKHNICVRNVEDLPQAIHEAFHIATTGRPGPVLVDMPKDVLTSKAPFDYSKVHLNDLPGYQITESFTEAQIDEALEILKTAERPILLYGGGVVNSGATQELIAFVDQFQLPVGSSLMGLGGFPTKHPLFMGFTGMHGHYWANIAIAKADVLFIVGNRLNERQTGKADRFARNAKIIHIDLDPTSLQKNVQVCMPIQGEIKNVLNAFMNRAENRMDEFEASMLKRKAWFTEIEENVTRRQEDPDLKSISGYLSPRYVISRLFHHMPDDGIVATEVGQHQMWSAQRFNLNTPRSWITSGGLGTMGFGFPAAIGAQVAHPDKTVLDIAGDGSFQMTLQELATAVDYRLPVKVAIINNGNLGMVRQWQDKIFTGASQAFMSSPDYVKLCDAYGAIGYTITRPDDVDRVIKEAFSIKDRPVIMDFHVHERTDVYPWVPAGGSNDEMLEENIPQEDMNQP